MNTFSYVLAGAVLLVSSVSTCAQGTQQPKTADQPKQKIPAGSRVYLTPMEGFETYLKEAIAKKKVPIEVVGDKEKADYEISGVSESKKAGAAKIVIMGSWHSREEASARVTNIKTGEQQSFPFTDTDMRFMTGTFISVDGQEHQGTFGFV